MTPLGTLPAAISGIRALEDFVRALDGRTETLRSILGFELRTLPDRERLLDAQLYLESVGAASLRDPELDDRVLYLIVTNPTLTSEEIHAILCRYEVEAQLCHVELDMASQHADVRIRLTW